MKEIVGEKLLEAFKLISPYLGEILNINMFVYITDIEKVIAHIPGDTIDTHAKVGDMIAQGASSAQAMKKGERIIINVSKEVYGVPYKAIATPVFDERNDIMGAIVLGISKESEEKFMEIVNQFGAAFEQNNSSIQEISNGAQDLARISEKLSMLSHRTHESIQRTDKIIGMIRCVADQTKMLSLNAAIEAAHAGIHGRGFAVVVNEINKLSQQSSISAKQVVEILDEIGMAVESIKTQSQLTSAVSEEQAASTQEMAASMQELSAQLETLTTFGKHL